MKEGIDLVMPPCGQSVSMCILQPAAKQLRFRQGLTVQAASKEQQAKRSKRTCSKFGKAVHSARQLNAVTRGKSQVLKTCPKILLLDAFSGYDVKEMASSLELLDRMATKVDERFTAVFMAVPQAVLEASNKAAHFSVLAPSSPLFLVASCS